MSNDLDVEWQQSQNQLLGIQTSTRHVDIPSFEFVETVASSCKQYLSPLSPTRPTSQPANLPPILAVIIGINKYKSGIYTNLTGATPDADAVENYLKMRLNVPEQNIYNLRDEQASRKAIISSFTWLRDNTAYKKDEAAIIFYFAGHGAQVETPADWGDWITATGKIGMLCPSDIGTFADGDGVQNEREQDVVPGIADRTISSLLSEIEHRKGNNITAIFDCCYAAAMVPSPKRNSVRLIANPAGFNCHSEGSVLPLSTSRGSTSSKDHQSSYTVLTACGRNEVASENRHAKCGLFTHHLLKVLENEDIKSLTYSSLMHKLDMPVGSLQTPQCEGDGIHWRLFNNGASGADKSMILTKRHGKNEEIILHAGSAQGVTVGSRFAVHNTNLLETVVEPNPCRGYLVVTRVDTLFSVLAFPPDIPEFRLLPLFYSKLDRLANDNIHVYSMYRVWLESIFPPHLRLQLSVVLVDTQQGCDLELTVLNGYVHFDQHNPLVTAHLPSRMPQTVAVGDVEVIRDVVKYSFHFYRNLTCISPRPLGSMSVELHKLLVETTEVFGQVFNPVGQNLIAEESAIIVVHGKVELGVTICNKGWRSLYPHLFYFNPTDLTITAWYLPPIGKGTWDPKAKVNAPFLPRSMVALGHGNEGGGPLSFRLPPNVNSDLGFFRLFLSTSPSSFDNILQEKTPFDGVSFRAILMHIYRTNYLTPIMTIIRVNP